jgi:hypothetical protein
VLLTSHRTVLFIVATVRIWNPATC